MAHLLPRCHWCLQFLSLSSSQSPPKGPGATLAAPKPGGKPPDALAVRSMKGLQVSLSQPLVGSCLNSPEPSLRRPK